MFTKLSCNHPRVTPSNPLRFDPFRLNYLGAVTRQTGKKQIENYSKMAHQQPDIQNRIMADMVSININGLDSIIKMMMFCGRQNIALCKNRDNTMDAERTLSIVKITKKIGANFWANFWLEFMQGP